MKERVRRIFCCIGTAGLMTVMMAVPAMADTTDSSDGYNWTDKVAANVLTYANIRSEADVSSERVGTLASGAVATVLENQDGWLHVVSGEVEGYLREDLVVSGEQARFLYEALYGGGEVKANASPITAETAPVSYEAEREQAAPVQSANVQEAAPAQETASVSGSDLDLMAAIIECEAGGEPYDGKIGVGAVIMNRMRSGQFPDSLSGVIYQSGQFEPVSTGKLNAVLSRGANADCYDAARDVFAGANTIGDRLFFHAGSGGTLTIANQTFY